MARKGWRPTGAGAPAQPAPAPDDEEPSALNPRRRAARRKRADDAAHPNLTAARKREPRLAGEGIRIPAGKRTPEDRHGITIQLGNRWSHIVTAVKAGEYTWAEFCDGLSEEELARCQLKADDGSFVGRPPVFVPREFLLACQREQKRRFEIIFGSEVLGIAKSYVELCKSKDIPEKDRAKMMQYAMERIFGGIPKDIRVSQEQPWETMVVNVVADEEDATMPDHLRRRYQGYRDRIGEVQDNG